MLKKISIIVLVLLNLMVFIFGCYSEYEVMPEIIPEGGGTVAGSGIYSEGEEVTLTAKPKEGYEFQEWTMKGEKIATNMEYTFILKEQIMPVAVFALQEYRLKLNVEPKTGGTVSGEGTYKHGETAKLKAEPAEGFQFRRWFLEGSPQFFVTELPFMVTRDTELTAEFSKDCTLELKSNIDQDNLKGTGTYEYGNEVEIVAPDEDEYRFIKWLEGDEVVSEDNAYRFTIETDRELTAVRELDLDLDNMFKKDNITGYLLPVLNYSKGTVKLINVTGETVVKESEYIQKDGQFIEYGPRGAVYARFARVGSTEPLALGLSYKGGRITAVFSHRGELLTVIPGGKHFDYNQHGYIDYKNNSYGFIDHNGNRVLDYEFDHISFGEFREYLHLYQVGTTQRLLMVTKNSNVGLADSRTGSMIIEPEYERIKRESWIGYDDVFKAEKDGILYFYSERGEMILALDYDEIKSPVGTRVAVKKDDKWGFIGPGGRVVVEPVYEQVDNFHNGYSRVRQGGRWGLIDTAGNIIVELQYQELTLRLGHTPPDGALARFQSNNTVGLFDFAGRIMFEGSHETFKLDSEHVGTELDYYPLETLGNYLIFLEGDRFGIKSITGEVVEAPVFEDFRLSRLGGIAHEYSEHANYQFEGLKVAPDYTAFKKEGYWAYFKDGEFVTDFKFTGIRESKLPVIVDDIVQLVVKEEGTEGLYDLESNRYIVAPGKYEKVDYLRNERIIVFKDGSKGVIDRNGTEIIEPGSYDFTGTRLGRSLFGIRKDGKYGFVDRNGKQLIDPVYDWITLPVNQVIMALKDGTLVFIDLEGQQVVESIEVDPEMARPHYIHGINMSYFGGPQVYNIFGNGYFNRNGWIKKPDEVAPY